MRAILLFLDATLIAASEQASVFKHTVAKSNFDQKSLLLQREFFLRFWNPNAPNFFPEFPICFFHLSVLHIEVTHPFSSCSAKVNKGRDTFFASRQKNS